MIRHSSQSTLAAHAIILKLISYSCDVIFLALFSVENVYVIFHRGSQSRYVVTLNRLFSLELHIWWKLYVRTSTGGFPKSQTKIVRATKNWGLQFSMSLKMNWNNVKATIVLQQYFSSSIKIFRKMWKTVEEVFAKLELLMTELGNWKSSAS